MNKKVEQASEMMIKYIEEIKLTSSELDDVITVLDEFFLLMEEREENSNVIRMDHKRAERYLR